jgi:hypothetical protein
MLDDEIVVRLNPTTRCSRESRNPLFQQAKEQSNDWSITLFANIRFRYVSRGVL